MQEVGVLTPRRVTRIEPLRSDLTIIAKHTYPLGQLFIRLMIIR